MRQVDQRIVLFLQKRHASLITRSVSAAEPLERYGATVGFIPYSIDRRRTAFAYNAFNSISFGYPIVHALATVFSGCIQGIYTLFRVVSNEIVDLLVPIYPTAVYRVFSETADLYPQPLIFPASPKGQPF